MGRGVAFAVVARCCSCPRQGRDHHRLARGHSRQCPLPRSSGTRSSSQYLLPFEVGSVVLLGAMIGAVVLARRAVKRDWERQ